MIHPNPPPPPNKKKINIYKFRALFWDLFLFYLFEISLTFTNFKVKAVVRKHSSFNSQLSMYYYMVLIPV